MPAIPQQETIVQYVTSSSQLTYTFAFYAPLATDIQVYYQSSTAIPIPATDILILNTNYTVSFNADPITGGTITLLFTPTSGYYLTINRQVQASLTTTFSNAQNFNGANLDAALDRLLLLCQQNQNYNLERNLSYIINTYLPNAVPFTQLPPLTSQQIWIGSGSGVIAATLEQNPDVSTLRSQLANNSSNTDGARLVGYYDTLLLNPTTVDTFLTLVNTNLTAVIGAVAALGNTYFSIIGKQILTSASGTYTPTVGTKYCWARGSGGGGGGGGAASNAGQAGFGLGGGSGAYGEAWFAAQAKTYTIGQGGAEGTAGNTGGAGTATLLQGVLNLGGGNGGLSSSNNTGATVVGGTLGGTVTTADFGVPGHTSDMGFLLSVTDGISGAGANSQYGDGAIGQAGTSNQNGSLGSGYGSGGSGAICFGAAGSTHGGAGQNGVLIIFEFG